MHTNITSLILKTHPELDIEFGEGYVDQLVQAQLKRPKTTGAPRGENAEEAPVDMIVALVANLTSLIASILVIISTKKSKAEKIDVIRKEVKSWPTNKKEELIEALINDLP